MATLALRPALHTFAGGFMHNKIEYVVTTANTFETLNVFVRGSAIQSFTEIVMRQSKPFGSTIAFDVYSIIQAYVNNKVITTGGAFEYTDYCEYYVSGTGFNDVANKRFAFFGAVDALVSNVVPYLIDVPQTTPAVFTNRLPEIVVLRDFECRANVFYSTIAQSSYLTVYINVKSFNASGILINETNTTMTLNVSYRNIHILLAFVATACTGTCKIQNNLGTYTKQLFQNSTFYDTSLWRLWNRDAGNLIGVNGSGTIPVAYYISPSGGGTIPMYFQRVWQLVYLQKGLKYKIKFFYTVSGAPATWKAFFDVNGSSVNFNTLTNGIGQTYEYIYTHTQISGNYPVGITTIAESLNVPSNLQYTQFEIIEEDYIQLSETKPVRYEQLNCRSPFALTWLNNLGAWETFNFDGFSDFVLNIIKDTNYLQNDSRQNTTIQKGSRNTRVLRQNNLTKEETIALQGLLTSKEVYLLEVDKQALLVELQGGSFLLNTTNESRFDMQVTCLLPYSNS